MKAIICESYRVVILVVSRKVGTQVVTLAPRPARSRLDLIGLGPAVVDGRGGGLTADEVDWARA